MAIPFKYLAWRIGLYTPRGAIERRVFELKAKGFSLEQVEAQIKEEFRLRMYGTDGKEVFRKFDSDPDTEKEERPWKWVTTSADPCDDCKARHGQVKPYEEWRRLGLPKSGFTSCGKKCGCVLIPTIQVGRSLEDDPSEADPIATARMKFSERLKTDPELRVRMESERVERNSKARTRRAPSKKSDGNP